MNCKSCGISDGEWFLRYFNHGVLDLPGWEVVCVRCLAMLYPSLKRLI